MIIRKARDPLKKLLVLKFKSQDEGESESLLFLSLEYRTRRLDGCGDGGAAATI